MRISRLRRRYCTTYFRIYNLYLSLYKTNNGNKSIVSFHYLLIHDDCNAIESQQVTINNTITGQILIMLIMFIRHLYTIFFEFLMVNY